MGAVVIASVYVPRPPEDNIWNARPRGITALTMPVGGGFPFKPQWQRQEFFYNDQGNQWDFWTPPRAREQVLDLVGGNFPFKPRFWKSHDNDPGSWGPKSFGPSLVLELASNLPVATAKRWKFDHDDTPVWYSQRSRGVNRVIDLAFVPPVVPSRWKYDLDDSAVWYTKPGAIPDNYYPQGGNFPIVPTRWRFNYDDASFWQNESVPVPPVSKLVGGNFPFVPSRWKLDYDDYGVWRASSTPVNRVIDLAAVAPLVPSRWKFDYNDPGTWETVPGRAIPENFLPVGGGFPFVPVRWRFNYDDAAFWVVDSFPKPIVGLLANGGFPIKPTFWKYNNDDAGVWNARSTPVAPVQGLIIAAPFTPKRWVFDLDYAATWDGGPSDVSVVITQPLPPIVPPVVTSQGGGWLPNRLKSKERNIAPLDKLYSPYPFRKPEIGTPVIEIGKPDTTIAPEAKTAPIKLKSFSELAPLRNELYADAAQAAIDAEEEEIAIMLLLGD